MEEPSAVPPARIDIVDEEDVPGTSGISVSVVNFLSADEQEALRNITSMFPDVDPHFIVEKLAQEQWKPDQLVQR